MYTRANRTSFKPGQSGNPGGMTKAAAAYLKKQLMPSLRKMAYLRDNAEEERLQGDMANKLADKVLGTGESSKPQVTVNNIIEKTYEDKK
jgi:hypothetical protein